MHTNTWVTQANCEKGGPWDAKDIQEDNECHTTPGKTKRTEDNKDDRITMDSLNPGKWLTCTVIDRQISSLATVYPKSMYLPALFFTRLYDMPKQTYTLHPVLHDVHRPVLISMRTS